MIPQSLEQQWLEVFPKIDLDNDRLDDGSSAREWIDAGFTPQQFFPWYFAGGFAPDRVKIIKDAGLTAGQVELEVTPEDQEKFGLEYSGETILFMFCDEKLTLENVQQLLDLKGTV